MEIDGETAKAVRLALGGVAHKPWRDQQAEALLASVWRSEGMGGDAAHDVRVGRRAWDRPIRTSICDRSPAAPGPFGSDIPGAVAVKPHGRVSRQRLECRVSPG